ncbi:unnamed protein product [Paramecium sonneborni]|uniref:Uncharacterized protein n=1 Tax=Paramecium sonneborni TaxID=65129 RepID=A0A8S1LLP7_9CILI|nr:unnamed protein product [Paramecium sonneborni]
MHTNQYFIQLHYRQKLYSQNSADITTELYCSFIPQQHYNDFILMELKFLKMNQKLKFLQKRNVTKVYQKFIIGTFQQITVRQEQLNQLHLLKYRYKYVFQRKQFYYLFNLQQPNIEILINKINFHTLLQFYFLWHLINDKHSYLFSIFTQNKIFQLLQF